VLVSLVVAALLVSGIAAAGSALRDEKTTKRAQPTTTTTTAPAPTTTTAPAPTTTTLPPTTIIQPPWATLPPVPGGEIGLGAQGPEVQAYEQRMADIHFDPGPVDGEYSQDTNYAVVAVEKLYGQPRDGVIGPNVKFVLEHFKYKAAKPKAEADRVEIDLDSQVLTVFKHWQPILITTTSTGSGEHFCGGEDGCQYAITPAGKFHFYYLHEGWDKGKLGKMWNPYYFNGSDAVHGLASVPAYPASHGCARIPMHIADYFHTYVHNGFPIYVVGTPSHALGVKPPTPATTTTTKPKVTTTTKPRKPVTTTTRPKTTTT
jgi:hypothetical protein